MNLRMLGGFVFLCVLHMSMAQGTPRDEPRARDCLDILNQGHIKSGVYSIQPTGLPVIKVACDMDTRGGGWTVIQRRLDGSGNFNRTWREYVVGFGDVYGEYWLGLENMFRFTHSAPMELLVSVEDFENNIRFAHYDNFAITSELSKFELDIGYYFGTAGDSLEGHRGGKFRTKDQDNDSASGICNEFFKAAWWSRHEHQPTCLDSNLNGQYQKDQQDEYGVVWSTWKGNRYSLKRAVMMIKPKYY